MTSSCTAARHLARFKVPKRIVFGDVTKTSIRSARCHRRVVGLAHARRETRRRDRRARRARATHRARSAPSASVAHAHDVGARAPPRSRSVTHRAHGHARPAEPAPRPRSIGVAPVERLHTLTRSIGRTKRCASDQHRARAAPPRRMHEVARVRARETSPPRRPTRPRCAAPSVSSPSSDRERAARRTRRTARTPPPPRARPRLRVARKHRDQLHADPPSRVARPASAAASPSAGRGRRPRD